MGDGAHDTGRKSRLAGDGGRVAGCRGPVGDRGRAAPRGFGRPAGLPAGTVSSANWAGYVDTAGPYAGVSAAWTVPALEPAPGAAVAEWVGLGGCNNNADLIQAGVIEEWVHGQAEAVAVTEGLPAAATMVACGPSRAPSDPMARRSPSLRRHRCPSGARGRDSGLSGISAGIAAGSLRRGVDRPAGKPRVSCRPSGSAGWT